MIYENLNSEIISFVFRISNIVYLHEFVIMFICVCALNKLRGNGKINVRKFH